MKPPKWWPWQTRRRWVIGPDVPLVYVKLLGLTNVYDPYKKKAYFLFVLGMSVIGMLDVPGLFFTNPYTHVVEGPAAYLGILGGITVGVLGAAGLWAYGYYKSEETMLFTFGAFNLRVRKALRVPFHAITGTIERVANDAAEQLKTILDKKLEEMRQLHKVQPLLPAPTPTQTTQTAIAPKEASPIVSTSYGVNLFYIPLPTLLEKCGCPGVFLLSRAMAPEDLTNPLPGEWIWEGWIRKGKGEVWDLGLCGEWQFSLPGTNEVQLVPIMAAAGTYFDFTWGLERAITPPVITLDTVTTAKQNAAARLVGLEAVSQLQVYKDALNAERSIKPTYMELATETAGNILELIMLRNKIGVQAVKESHSKLGAVIGAVVVIATLGFLTFLAFHGWHL